MIGIIITEENKEQNQLPNAVGSIMVQQDYPNIWWGVQRCVGGYKSLIDLHYNDGWRSVTTPTINDTQKLGELYLDEINDVFTYYILDKSDSEIQGEILTESEFTKENRLKEISDSLLLEIIYNETDTQTILDNTDLYPMFEEGISVLNEADSVDGIPYRCKDFNDENELVLWEAVLSHTTALEWPPKDVPALFKRVTLDGEIPVWVQPLGSFDSYQTGDKVHFPSDTDPIYESVVDNNVWQPLVYGWQLV